MTKFTISLLVANEAGVLTRIAGLFARRCFNINSLTVGETENPALSRMTITTEGDEQTKEQIIKQLMKLHDVKAIKEMEPERTVSRELILIKVAADSRSRQDIIDAANIFRNKIVDFSPDVLCMEVTGESRKLDAFIELMKGYGILEMCRTGCVALDRGAVYLKI